jgi:IS5 family transposase
MTTLDGVTKKKPAEQSAEQQAAVELVRLAQEQRLSLTGPDGLLKQLTKTVLETALNEEMTEHLGYEKHDPAGAGTGNIRNGTRVPHPTTLMKITTRCGEGAVAGLNEALLAKAAAAKLLRTDKVRADTTVVQAAVAYPTD